MAQHLVELCGILVEESFGDTASIIWAQLAQHGRTQFAELVNIAKVTPDRLAQLLPILILNRAIVYYVDPDYNATWYSVDLEGTYNLLRMSRLGDIVKERCGKDAAHVITNTAQLGHITVGELVSAYGFGLKHSMSTEDGATTNGDTEHVTNGTTAGVPHDDTPRAAANGIGAVKSPHVNGETMQSVPRDVTPIKTVEQLYAALTALIRAGFLIKANAEFFQTDYDLQQQLEKQVQEEQFPDGKVTGPKASQLYNNAVRDRKRKQREGDYDVDGILGQPGRSRKKAKLNSGQAIGHAHQLNGDLILSINMRKYVVALRSKSYVRLATSYLGQSSGAIYSTLLQALEQQIPEIPVSHRHIDSDTKSVDEDDIDLSNPRVTVTDVYNIIDHGIDFTSSIKVPSKDLPQFDGKKAPVVQAKEDFSGIGIKAEPESDDEGIGLDSFANRAKLLELIERHLHSIEEHPRQFCQREGLGKPSVWSVDFPDLTESLMLTEIDNAITARFGKTATRLVRLLRDRGKLEEKQISACAFMQMKDVRSILTALYAAGYVEAQEIAKDSTRQPAKALYLWYLDTARVQRMIIHQCYQSMSRAYQRMAKERERFKTVIAKAQRLAEAKFFGDHWFPKHEEDEDEDDGDDEDESTLPVRFVLGPTGMWKGESMNHIEKDQLKEWRGIEANFLGQIMRLDDIVLLLRDFSGQYSLTSA